MIFAQDENDNEENEEENLTTNSAMETDSLDYSDQVNVPIFGANGSPAGSSAKGRKHPFLQRSDSTLCLGCPPVDPFDTPLSEALPLADQPHLLQPHSRREDLFGVPRISKSTSPNTGYTLEGLPTRLSLSARNQDNQANSCLPTFSQVVPSFSVNDGRKSGGDDAASKANVSLNFV